VDLSNCREQENRNVAREKGEEGRISDYKLNIKGWG
jgi:hypothetical protein